MKWYWIMLLAVFLPSVIAETNEIQAYPPNKEFSLSVNLINSSGVVSGASCYLTIKNSSYGTIDIILMNEISAGWYNATYNNSRLGKYYCTQNCSKNDFFDSDTCDFIIGEEDNMVLGMIVFIPLFIAAFFLVFAWFLPSEKWWALKLALPILGLVFIFQSYQYGVIAISETVGSDNLIDAIGFNSFIYGMVFWFILIALILYLVYEVFMLFSNKKYKTGDYGRNG